MHVMSNGNIGALEDRLGVHTSALCLRVCRRLELKGRIRVDSCEGVRVPANAGLAVASKWGHGIRTGQGHLAANAGGAGTVVR